MRHDLSCAAEYFGDIATLLRATGKPAMQRWLSRPAAEDLAGQRGLRGVPRDLFGTPLLPAEA